MRNGFKGYVDIRITGRNIERFISKLTHEERIKVYSIRRDAALEQSGFKRSIIITIDATNFKKLRPLARKYRCRMHIVDRGGLPFKLNELKRRPVLMFGWIVSLAVLIWLSKYIWIIEVSGCNFTSQEHIIETLNELGITEGSKLNEDRISEAREVLLRDERIAWVDVNRKGVKLYVDIVEVKSQMDSITDNAQQNIYANSDGIIISITPYSGRAVVSAGDAVKKGDLLISGDLSTEEAELFTVARGKVMAQVPYSFSYTADPIIVIQQPTGNETSRTGISLFGFNFARPVYDDCITETVDEEALSGFFIPLRFLSQICRETANVEREGSKSELTEIAIEGAQRIMQDSLSHEITILSKTSETIEHENGAIEHRIMLTVEEDIAS